LEEDAIAYDINDVEYMTEEEIGSREQHQSFIAAGFWNRWDFEMYEGSSDWRRRLGWALALEAFLFMVVRRKTSDERAGISRFFR
jgi:hypothetical protein